MSHTAAYHYGPPWCHSARLTLLHASRETEASPLRQAAIHREKVLTFISEAVPGACLLSAESGGTAPQIPAGQTLERQLQGLNERKGGRAHCLPTAVGHGRWPQ